MVEKRERLVSAAARVIQRSGYAGTTLALIAKDAKIPLGNVYYYFKTKEDLAHAVVDSRVEELRALLALAEKKSSPLGRLRAFIAAFEAATEVIIATGCKFGNLTQELDKRGDDLAANATRLFSIQVEWFEVQFRALGAGARSGDLAVELLCAIQGACLVGLGLKDSALYKKRLRAISRRLGRSPALKSG